MWADFARGGSVRVVIKAPRRASCAFRGAGVQDNDGLLVQPRGIDGIFQQCPAAAAIAAKLVTAD